MQLHCSFVLSLPSHFVTGTDSCSPTYLEISQASRLEEANQQPSINISVL